MLHIFCPHCGELRSEEEFHASGQAHIRAHSIQTPAPMLSGATTCSFATTHAACTTNCGTTLRVAVSSSTPRATP